MLDFKKIFVEKLGEPDDEDALDSYIEFILLAKKNGEDIIKYTEGHHLLPKSKFPEYIYAEENIFILEYSDHVHAHILLANAYKIKSFIVPLNFMLGYDNKSDDNFSELWSAAIKKWWVMFKQTDEYEVWRQKRSAHASRAMKNGQASYMANIYFSIQENRDTVGKRFSELWKDPEYRERTIASMVAEKSTPEAKVRMSKAAQSVWDNKSEEERAAFNAKMAIINSDPNKRARAGETASKTQNNQEWKDTVGVEKSKKLKEIRNSEEWKDNVGREAAIRGGAKGSITKQTNEWKDTVGKASKEKNAMTRSNQEWKDTVGKQSRAKQSETIRSEEWLATKGKDKAEKISKARSSSEGKKKRQATCTRCGFVGDVCGVARWHNENCTGNRGKK